MKYLILIFCLTLLFIGCEENQIYHTGETIYDKRDNKKATVIGFNNGTYKIKFEDGTTTTLCHFFIISLNFSF